MQKMLKNNILHEDISKFPHQGIEGISYCHGRYFISFKFIYANYTGEQYFINFLLHWIF